MDISNKSILVYTLYTLRLHCRTSFYGRVENGQLNWSIIEEGGNKMLHARQRATLFM